MYEMPSHWLDDNKRREDGKHVSGWAVSLSSRLSCMQIVFYVTQSGSIGRWVCLRSRWDQVQMSVSVQANFYIPHAAKQIRSSSSDSQEPFSVFSSPQPHQSSGLHRGAPAFKLNVQMSSITQSRSKTTWQKQHNRQRITFCSPWNIPSTLRSCRIEMKWISLCATKLMEEKISERLCNAKKRFIYRCLRRKQQNKDINCTYSDKRPNHQPGRLCPVSSSKRQKL